MGKKEKTFNVCTWGAGKKRDILRNRDLVDFTGDVTSEDTNKAISLVWRISEEDGPYYVIFIAVENNILCKIVTYTVFVSKREGGNDISISTVLQKLVTVIRTKLEGREKDPIVQENFAILKWLVLQLYFFRRLCSLRMYENMDAENFVKQPS